jgi:hypothetical protein
MIYIQFNQLILIKDVRTFFLNILNKIIKLKGKYWVENRLKYFSFPWNMSRDQALTFCSNNNGTLMYWDNTTEQNILQSLIICFSLFLIFTRKLI